MYNLYKYGLVKKNYLGNEVFVVGGIILLILSLVFYYILNLAGLINDDIFYIYLYITLITGAIGFVDDIAGSKEVQGFKGHVNSLIEGELTTGALKIFVITIMVFFLIIEINSNLFEIIPDMLIMLLLTNFLNLMDLRPGRSIKMFIIISAIIIFFINLQSWIYFLPYYLSFVFYLPFEMRSRFMLGDTGANLLGIVLGLNFVLFLGNNFLKIILSLILITLTMISEKYSYSELIKNNKILNYIDMIGR
ncbi:MAG: UDP-N-acetylmuramyl pentapeptide phosphotransferase [Bacillota bacterium]